MARADFFLADSDLVAAADFGQQQAEADAALRDLVVVRAQFDFALALRLHLLVEVGLELAPDGAES